MCIYIYNNSGLRVRSKVGPETLFQWSDPGIPLKKIPNSSPGTSLEEINHLMMYLQRGGQGSAISTLKSFLFPGCQSNIQPLPWSALVWRFGVSSGQEWLPLISHPHPSHSPNCCHQLSWKVELEGPFKYLVGVGWGVFCFILIGRQLLYNVMLVSALCIHMSPPPWTSFPPPGHHRALSWAPSVTEQLPILAICFTYGNAFILMPLSPHTSYLFYLW